jgi:hypothetical protein
MFSQVARYPASNLGNYPQPWPCRRMRAVRRGDRVALTIGPRQLRGGVASCGSSPARPTLGGSRSAERGYTGRVGRCSRPRRKFGFRRRRAPSVRRRRRGVCHGVSAQPCLDCSPTQAGQTLLGLAYPAGRACCGRVGSVAAGSSALVVLGAVVGLAGRGGPKGSAPPAPTHGRLPGQPRSAGRSRGAGAPASPRAARRRFRPGRSPGRGGVVCLSGRQ